MGKKRRSFSKDFKLDVVKLVKEGGLSASRAAKDLGIYETSLRRWIKQYEIDHSEGPTGALTTAEKEELRRLRRDLQTDVEMVRGHYGEFKVLVDGDTVIDGGALTMLSIMPSRRKVVDAVRARLAA